MHIVDHEPIVWDECAGLLGELLVQVSDVQR
jgi:hypothetical protein